MDWNFNTITKSPRETENIAFKLATQILEKKRTDGQFLSDTPRIICLSGDLGTGKTIFVRGFAKALGIAGRLLSPTFIIVRRYTISSHFFYHVDAYRIRAVKNTDSLGFSEIMADKSSLICIEWPERIGHILPVPRLDITITLGKKNSSRNIRGIFIK